MKPKSLPILKKEEKNEFIIFFSVATGILKNRFIKPLKFWVNFHNKTQSKLQDR